MGTKLFWGDIIWGNEKKNVSVPLGRGSHISYESTNAKVAFFRESHSKLSISDIDHRLKCSYYQVSATRKNIKENITRITTSYPVTKLSGNLRHCTKCVRGWCYSGVNMAAPMSRCVCQYHGVRKGRNNLLFTCQMVDICHMLPHMNGRMDWSTQQDKK